MSIDDVLSGRARWTVVCGDATDVVPTIPTDSISAVVSDPPSGIAFMGATWDKNKGGRIQWVSWLSTILSEARRATRDGGRALVWSLPRTSHWTGCAVEDAGWFVESNIVHLFGTGFPKAKSQLKPAQETWWLARNGASEELNIDDCRIGTQKRVPGSLSDPATMGYGRETRIRKGASFDDGGHNPNIGRWPTNLLLSHSSGCVCEGTRRVPTGTATFTNTTEGAVLASYSGGLKRQPNGEYGHADTDGMETIDAWHCVDDCPVLELDRQSGESSAGTPTAARGTGGMFSGVSNLPCGPQYGDEGTASRFFPQFPADDPDAPWSEALFRYIPKPSTAEREAGLREAVVGSMAGGGADATDPVSLRFTKTTSNTHPTVKSVALMRWLIRLVSKPGDVILDPFGGSATTGVAALLEKRRVILIEREPEYVAIGRARCEATDRIGDWTKPIRAAVTDDVPAVGKQLGLFAPK